MKKNILLILNCVVISGIAMAQSTKETKSTAVATTGQETKAEANKPVIDILWINESTHNFGTIPQGKPVTTEFSMKNTGKDSLKLETVRAGCGCTTPIWAAGPYAPGENFKITVGYNAASEGSFTKPVTITYNGGQQKVINITGTVYKTPTTPAPQNSEIEKLQN